MAKAEHDEASAQSGKAALKDAEQIRNAEHVERVMRAPLIDRQGFLDIKTGKNKGQLTLPERAALEKYELERAFGLSLTEDIVRQNLDERLRERVEIFADLGSIGMFRLNKNRAEECSVLKGLSYGGRNPSHVCWCLQRRFCVALSMKPESVLITFAMELRTTGPAI